MNIHNFVEISDGDAQTDGRNRWIAVEWTGRGIVVSTRHFGEDKAIVNVLTEDLGRHPGLVHGSGRRTLQPGTAVMASWRGRGADSLGSYRCEVVAAPSPMLLADSARLEALAAACVVVETALPEREPNRSVFSDLCVLLAVLSSTGPWGCAFVRWEVGLLGDLGYGLDLGCCALTGVREGLCFVSPRTGRAVCREAARPYLARLLPLPAFLTDAAAPASPADLVDGLRLTGHFLERNVYAAHNRPLPAARLRLVRHFESGAVSG